MKGDAAADEFVVSDTVPIVVIGSTNSYFATIPEELGRIPFRTRRWETFLIHSSLNEK
jgi:hypothetical protein